MCFKTGRVQISSAVSLGKEDIDAFKKGFYYHETIGKQNEDKKYVKMAKLVTDTNRLNKTFKKPWKYGFCVFTTTEKNEQISDAIKRNGNSLIGEKKNKTAT